MNTFMDVIGFAVILTVAFACLLGIIAMMIRVMVGSDGERRAEIEKVARETIWEWEESKKRNE